MKGVLRIGYIVALGFFGTVAPATAHGEAVHQNPQPLNIQPQPDIEAADSAVSSADSLRPPKRETATRLGPRRREARETEAHPTGFFHSPTSKLLRSVAFPGWGQWSNGKKQKAVVYFALESYFFTRALIWRHRTFDRLHTWEGIIAARGNCLSGECQQAFDDYDTARDRRNYFYWLTGATIFVAMFDAYADAYLMSLEHTRDKGDDYWGGQAACIPDDEFRLLATLRF